MQASVPERLISALGAGLSVLLLGYLLLVGMAIGPAAHDRPETLLALPLPRPHEEPPKPHRAPHESKRLPKPEGKAAKRLAIPALVLPPLPTISVPLIGPTLSSGTSDQAGMGTGAGGQGNGTGGGGDGGDGDDTPPRLLKGRLKFSDLPESLRDRDTASSVSVRYAVEVDGRVDNCIVTASSGSAELDQRTCELIQQRFRFAPSRDRDGNPVRSTIEENHRWEIERLPPTP